jgi:hypothetical protein
MSIELIVKRLPDGPEQRLPVSTSPAFERYWLPVARQLHLHLVPLMSDSLFLLEQERVELVRELCALADWFAEHARVTAAEPGPIEERLHQLVSELEQRNCREYELSFC